MLERSINRYYDPTTDQFLSIDPLVAQTGQPYAFTNDSPLNVTDPLGLEVLDEESPQGEPIADLGGEIHVSGESPGESGGDAAGIDFKVTNPSSGEVQIDEGKAGHIFRDDSGHVADTPENRSLIIDTANNPNNYVRTESSGAKLYRQTLGDGRQVWAKVFDAKITNGGINNVPLK